MVDNLAMPNPPSSREADLALFAEDRGVSAYRQRFVELLRVLSYERREVVLSSGKRSNFYIDCKQTILTAEGHFLCGQLVHYVLMRSARTIRAVGGMTMGADPIASAVSTLSFLGGFSAGAINAFYLRKEPKGHGSRKWLEGDKGVPPGTEVAIVEDVVTTGASTLLAVERAREHGLIVRHVVALCDRQEGGRAAVEAEVPMTAICHRVEFES